MKKKVPDTNAAIERGMRGLRAAIPQAEKDPTRPVYHFRPLARWMNDPCGTIYHQGYYHLFYQLGAHTDRLTMEAELYWGHARSPDLVHWEHLPIALWASSELGERRCNSGCVVMNGKGEPMIFYTHCPADFGPRQQWAALGDEDLIRWEKHPANPIITAESWASPALIEDMNKWANAFVFRAEGRTFMVVGVNLKEQVTLPIWEAQDDELVRWKYRRILLQAPKTKLEDMECPNFFPLGDKWVLLCSPGGMVRYFIGTFDADSVSFQVEKEGIVDYSVGEPFPDFWTRGLYATNILVDDKGRTIMFGWVSGFKLGRAWNGCLSLPRVLTIGADGLLRQEPVPELQKLREQHIRLDALNLKNGGHVIEEPGGETLEILAVFEPGDAETIGLKLRRSDDGRKAITISYDGRTLDVVGTAVPFKLAGDEKTLTLHVFLDKTVMEVFVNGGRECVTKVIYSGEQDLGLELFATGGRAMVRSVDIWRIKPIW